MKKIIKNILVVMVLGGIIFLGNKIVSAQNIENSSEDMEEVKVEEEREATKAPLMINHTTTMAGPEIAPITKDEAVRLLSQIDYVTLNLDSSLEDYEFLCEEDVDDIDGIEVYVVKAYEKLEKSQEPAGIYYVTTDGNGMYKKEFSTGSCINLETGEVIDGEILENDVIE